MKKKTFAALLLSAITIAACQKNKSATPPAPVNPVAQSTHSASRISDPGDTASSYISTSAANTMISSYLASVNSTENDSVVRSFSVNADSLRAYLSNSSVKNIKLVFGHTMKYIDAGNYGVNSGYQSGTITIIIAAYDADGNYVYHNGLVLDHCVPCPYSCPPGNAGNSLF